MTERVLDLAPDGRDSEDDVGAHNGAGNRDPAESFPQLEGKCDHVHPCYLTDGDRIGDWEGRVEDTFGASKDLV